MPRYFLVLLLCFGVVFGAGCKKTQTNTPTKPTNATTTDEQQAFLPPLNQPESERQQNLRELREALRAFQTVKTVRAKLSLTSKDGLTTGQIDIVKPDRFHGTLHVPKQTDTSEVIGVASTLYLRLPDGSWTAVNTPKVAKALNDAFRSAVDGDQSIIQKALPDDTVVSKQEDTIKNCTRYRADLKTSEGQTTNISLCVAQNLPRVIELQTSNGQATVEYFDYNKLFTIERPVVKQ